MCFFCTRAMGRTGESQGVPRPPESMWGGKPVTILDGPQGILAGVWSIPSTNRQRAGLGEDSPGASTPSTPGVGLGILQLYSVYGSSQVLV